MNNPVSIIRAIVRDELKSLRLGDLAVVTSVFPHAEGDSNNYECNVKLRDGELELQKVPVATPHIGMVSTPNVGDLVMVTYIGADPNLPIIIGRLYSDKANPPEHVENEWKIQAPFNGETEIAIDKDESITLTSGKTVLTVQKDGAVQLNGETDLKIEVKGNVDLKCTDCKIDASGNVDLGSGGTGVITENSHKCYFTGAALMGSKEVKAKG
ncbi:MAG: hypothetical protein GY714_15150 [Desulfobacterales bacterium]|nr:hypothetical protein [Desulfobacterales bacterium]MCP4162112.1 hypothetical protein [Deltaproteobacteria bacterium]